MYYLAELTSDYEDTHFDVIEFSEDKDYLEAKCELLNAKFDEQYKLFKEAEQFVKSKGKLGKLNKFVRSTKEGQLFVYESDNPNTHYKVKEVKKETYYKL